MKARPVVTSVSQATRPSRIVAQHGVQHRVGDLVGDLVGVPFGHRLRGEEVLSVVEHQCTPCRNGGPDETAQSTIPGPTAANDAFPATAPRRTRIRCGRKPFVRLARRRAASARRPPSRVWTTSFPPGASRSTTASGKSGFPKGVRRVGENEVELFPPPRERGGGQARVLRHDERFPGANSEPAEVGVDVAGVFLDENGPRGSSREGLDPDGAAPREQVEDAAARDRGLEDVEERLAREAGSRPRAGRNVEPPPLPLPREDPHGRRLAERRASFSSRGSGERTADSFFVTPAGKTGSGADRSGRTASRARRLPRSRRSPSPARVGRP